MKNSTLAALFASQALALATSGSDVPTTTLTAPNTKPSSLDGAKWSLLGCYAQPDANSPILSSKPETNVFMSIGMCTSKCAAANFPFAGLAENLCWCGSMLDGVLAENKTDCNVPCPGYPGQVCGGVGAVSVYGVEEGEGVVILTTVKAPEASITKAPATSESKTGTSSVLSSVATGGAMRNYGVFGW